MKNKHRKQGRNRLKAKRARWRGVPISARANAAAFEEWWMDQDPNVSKYLQLGRSPDALVENDKNQYDEMNALWHRLSVSQQRYVKFKLQVKHESKS